MDKLKKIIYWIAVCFVIPSVVYYSSRFYIEDTLSFDKSMQIPWTIIVVLIIFIFVYCFTPSKRVKMLTQKNRQID